MQHNFLIALDFTLSQEGGYVNDPADPGGETNFGISKRFHPGEDIKNMTKDRAAQIYQAKYWEPAMCSILPTPVDIVHFDTAVNMGVVKAGKILQLTLNRYMNGSLRVDGVIGKATLKEMEMAPLRPIFYAYIIERLNAYRQVCAETHTQKRFLFGWINRVMALRDYIDEHI